MREFTDHTPQWYSNGRWAFSHDNRTLVFDDKTAGSIRIDLAIGTIVK